MTLKDFVYFQQFAANIKNFEKTTNGQKVGWNAIKFLKLDALQLHSFQFHMDHSGEIFTVDLFQHTQHSIPNPMNLCLQPLRTEFTDTKG